MLRVLNELKEVPGVIGAYLFHLREGVQEGNLPPLFRPEKLTGMGRLLTRLHASGRQNFPDLSETTLYFEETVLVVREAGPERFLVVVADPAFQANLLTMALNLAADELSGRRQQAVPTAPPTPSPLSLAALMSHGPLAVPLGAMQTLLAKVMGPIAPIVFREAAEEWLRDGKPSVDSLPVLVDLLDREIGDPGKIKTYRQIIAPHVHPSSGR